MIPKLVKFHTLFNNFSFDIIYNLYSWVLKVFCCHFEPFLTKFFIITKYHILCQINAACRSLKFLENRKWRLKIFWPICEKKKSLVPVVCSESIAVQTVLRQTRWNLSWSRGWGSLETYYRKKTKKCHIDFNCPWSKPNKTKIQYF